MNRWLVLACAFFGCNAVFAFDGYVTPSTVVITMTSLDLIPADGGGSSSVIARGSSIPITFNSADADFATIPLADVTFPTGTFKGVNVCYQTSRSIKLSDVVYHGNTTGSYTNVTSHLWTALLDAIAPHSLVTAAPGGGATLAGNFVVGSGSENCSQTIMTTPVCINGDGSGGCTNHPTVTLLLDMAHSAGVDATNETLDSHVASYPYATVGAPGAAIHLSYHSGTTYGDVSLLIGTDKKVVFATSLSMGSIGGFCTGVPGVTATAAPPGVTLYNGGVTMVIDTDTSTGTVQFPTGNCGTGSTCTSSGLLSLDNIYQAVGSSVSVNCTADTTGSLGYTYAGGPGAAGGPTTFTVQKIVDPTNLLGLGGNAGSYP